MDSNYLQQQRFLLQKKVKRLNSCNHKLFHSLFMQFWGYLNSHAIYGGVILKLQAESPSFEDDVSVALQGRSYHVWDSELEAMRFTFRVLEKCAAVPVDGHSCPEAKIGRAIANKAEHDANLDAFRDAYLEPFYEYLDEALDGQAAVLSLLLKYKRHVEWFERDSVRALIVKGGERKAASHMYAYLFNQGLDFHIEPQSISGEADLVATDLVLDAKLFDGSTSKGIKYVLRGVNQLLNYAQDFQQQVGYLVIYRVCPEDLQFSFARPDLPVPFMEISGRIVYYLVVDVCDYATSASKRGELKAHLIEADMVRTVVSEKTSVDIPALLA
jgi:hypothetical protein